MDVSIIIPCYNQGHYLNDALESITASNTNYTVEIIIVNDGSTDPLTLKALNEIEAKGISVIHQQNKGLAAARNVGIEVAKGKYILPLDADNKIHSNYLVSAVEILNTGKTDVVYGNKQLFGEEDNYVKVGPFNMDRLINGNYIDACAIFTKATWEKAGGFDGKMPAMGNEDWEFWISASIAGARFHYLDSLCFYYRVTNNSMRLQVTNPAFELNKDFIIHKHASYFYSFYHSNYRRLNYLKKHPVKAGINLIFGRLGV